MNVTDSERRRNNILGITVESYVSTATPVGSELICRKLRQAFSPATIRHIMGELERDGLLEQPHTSAGRVPTERGYRVYVDAIMETRHPTSEEIRRIEALIVPEELAFDQMMSRASAALAELAQEVAFIVVPTVKRRTVKQVELVPLSLHKVLCVLIAQQEMIVSHVVEIEEPLSRDEAASLARFLNSELVGLPCNDLLSLLERRLLAETDSVYHLVKRSLDILHHALSTEPDERLFLEGASYVIAQPEFSKDPRKAHEFVKQLEDETQLCQTLRQDLATGDVQVRIGREMRLSGFDECSCVTAPLVTGREVIGGVGVLGPKRMNYPHLSSLVEGMARSISDVLVRWGVGG